MRGRSTLALLSGSALLVYLITRKSDSVPVRWVTPPPGWTRGLPPVLTSVEANVLGYRFFIMREAERIGIEAAIIAAIIDVESKGDPRAVRDEGFDLKDGTRAMSYGLMQIRWTTALMMKYSGSKAGLFDPETNITYGANYLDYQHKRYGDVVDAIAAYNSGTVDQNIWGTYSNQAYVDDVTRRVYPYRRHLKWYYPGYDIVFPV